jgi:hypothetical protein
MRRSFGIGGMWHNSVSECLPHDYSGEYSDDACLSEALMIPASNISPERCFQRRCAAECPFGFPVFIEPVFVRPGCATDA